MIDLHIHSILSYDSKELPENYVIAAKKRGERMLGFAEHYDYDMYLRDRKTKLCNLKALEEHVFALNYEYRQFKVLKGIEFGYSKEALAQYRKVEKDNEFDYVILSVHTLGGKDCYDPEAYDGFTKKEAYKQYFNTVLESVSADVNYQILGHLGYVSRHAPYTNRKIIYKHFASTIDEILKQVIARGVSLEINGAVGSSGASFLPDCDILDRYIELGGKNFTYGSDAHSAVGYQKRADGVKDYLLSRGINQICYYVGQEIKRKTFVKRTKKYNK